MPRKTPRQGKPVKKKDDSWLDDDVRVNTGLPPQVDGQIRCFCKLTVSQIVWAIPRPPDLALVRVKWWGEEEDGILFRPLDVKKGNKTECRTTSRYPVRSGPCQFATYLNDMGSLTLELLTAPDSEVVGQASIPQIGLLTNTRPINGFFPVISATGQKLANLQVAVVLEPLMASYDSKGSIPTTDVGMDNAQKNYDSLVVPETSHPLPYSDLPVRPDNQVFISPPSQNKAGHQVSSKTYNGDSLRQQLSYGSAGGNDSGPHQQTSAGAVAITTNGDVINLPDSRALTSSGGFTYPGNINNSSTSGNRSSPVRASASGGRDLLSVLVEKGTKLREAMIVSSMHSGNGSPLRTKTVDSKGPVSAPSASTTEGLVIPQDFGGGYKYDADHLLSSPIKNQDFQLYNLMNGLSPGTSMSSDLAYDHMMSEMEDPMHDNSILQELFYYNSDNDAVGLSDLSGYDHRQPQQIHQYMSLPGRLPGGSCGLNSGNPLDEPGNQRPPSRASSITSLDHVDEDENSKSKTRKTKRRMRSRSRSSSRSRSRSNSQTRSRSNSPRKPAKSAKQEAKENVPDATKDSKTVKPKKKVRSRSTSRSRSRSRKRKSSVDAASDSDQMSTARSEISRVSFDPVTSDMNKPRQEGLSIERLTLLGRVHVARVNIDCLQLLKSDVLDMSDSRLSGSKFKSGKPPRPQKSKKPCTHFVEYQFPVVATSRDKYTPNAMATEVTRVASKNVKDNVLMFNHRSVFPILFDGAAVERWWKSALVFRLYCKEPGQHTPTLIGSGGISLKSILRSENLFVQRELEIPDTSKNGLLNKSQSSSFNSSVSGRANVNLYGKLKISVELASDHKEFATVMARTKLAEMSGNVKIVPIGGISPEQARLVEQLNKNKDQPIIKSPTKKIDFPMTTSQPQMTTAVSGLPPQSPRRKQTDSPRMEVEEGDEISCLKQQLKATLAVLNKSNNSQSHGATSHLDSGAQVFGGQQGAEVITLSTLLYIQEGRNIPVQGVPPLHMINKNPALLQAQTAAAGRDNVIRNTYLVCRMFWCNDAVHSNVCWGTLNPEYNFLQVAPVMMTIPLLERMRDNYMIVEVWDKKVSSDNDKLIGMVKLSLHQFYLSFRERKIANALLKSEYPVMAIDNYMPIVDPFSGLHFGQLKVVLAMGSEQQIGTIQRLALDTTGMEPVPQKPSSYLERQDVLKGGDPNSSGRAVEHQFEIVIEGLRGLKLFENMIWGEADCFVQFFFPTEGEEKEEAIVSAKSLPTMKCFRTATTLCIPDPTFHDTSRHKLTLPLGVPVQRELLTACANSGGGVSGLPFEVWCRYYHPNVRDQLIAKSTLPLAKLCAMITMHKRGEACVQSFSLRLSQVGVEGQQDNPEAAAKSKDAGVLDLTINYKTQAVQSESAMAAVSRNHDGSQVCLSVGIIRASGLKAAADYVAQFDSAMAYPADVGVNAYVRINISFLGKENERMTKTIARSFAPEFAHYMDFPCPLLMSNVVSSDATSLAELLESAEVTFEVWHQMPTGLHRDNIQIEKSSSRLHARKLAHHTGDILLGTTIVPLMSLLTRRTGLNGWFAISLPSLGWAKPIDENDIHHGTALDQVVGGLELSLRFAHQEDRDRIVSVARSVGWSPIDIEVEQPDWQDEDSHHNVHNISVSIDQVSFPLTSALITGHTGLDPSARCYVRYKFYDKGAVVSKCRKLHMSDSGSLLSSLSHKHSFVMSHTAPLQWYLMEERLEIQAWVTYGRGREREKKPRQRDKLVGSCFIDLESLTDMRRRQQRVSGLFPLFKPGTSNLKAAFIRAHITSRVSSSVKDQPLENELGAQESDVSMSASETDQSSDGIHQWIGDFSINKSPKKRSRKDARNDPQTSFSVLLAVDRAMHLPMVTEKNRSGEICPSTYVSYQSAERSKPTCSSIFPNSVNPVWDYAVETRLSTVYLYKENKNLVLKVWHKPSDAPKTPDKSSDKVLGFVSVDLTSLTKGLQQICGWYNIMDFNGQCRGQIKVSITPQDLQANLPSGATPNSSFMVPHFGLSSMSTNTQAVASNIAQQLVNLQQQVMQRMEALSGRSDAAPVVGATSQDLDITQNSANKDQDSSTANTTGTSHWQPKLVLDTRTDNPSKSYLFSSLRRQLQDLDTITNKLKMRLSTPAQDGDTSQLQINSARSGDILSGTQSGLSTIHTASSLMNTREMSSLPSRYNASSSEVGTSQESARSRTINNSTTSENVQHTGETQEETSDNRGRRLLDSGVFSAKNFSEKSGEDAPDSHRSDKNVMAVMTSDNMSILPGNSDTLRQSSARVDTLEAAFLASAGEKTQTLFTVIDNSESSGNSHGFIPGTQRSTVTESLSVKDLEKGRKGSKGTASNSASVSKSGSKHSQSQSGSGSARSEKNTIEEKREDVDYESDEEDDEATGHRSGRYGSYHQYRELLDAEDDDRESEEEEVEEDADEEDDADVVEIVPRSLNNMSTVLALGARSEDPGTGDGAYHSPSREDQEVNNASSKLDKLMLSPASPNVNAHEGTSVWCSEDNDDSFFQQVFEKNRQIMEDKGESVGDVKVDSWLQDPEADASQVMLENWLNTHVSDRDEAHKDDDSVDNEFDRVVAANALDTDDDDDEKDDTLKAETKDNIYSLHNDGAGDEEVTPRSTEMRRVSDEGMRLQLGQDSDHDSDDDTLKGKGASNIVWNQNIGNSSDEETSRNMWTKQQALGDFFEEQKEQTTSRLEELQLKNDEGEGSGEDADKVGEMPASFANTPPSLLSNVELMDSMMLSGQNERTLPSTLSSSSAPNGRTLHSTSGTSSITNGHTLQSTFSEVSSLPSNQRTADEYPFTLVPANTQPQEKYLGEGARPKVRHMLSNVDLESNSSSQRPNSGSSRRSVNSVKSNQSKASHASKASAKSKESSLKSFAGSDRSSRKSEKSATSLGQNNLEKTSQNSHRSTLNNDVTMNPENQDEAVAGQLSQVPDEFGSAMSHDLIKSNSKTSVSGQVNNSVVNVTRCGHNDRDSTLDSAFVEGDHSYVHSTHPNSMVMMNGFQSYAEDLTPEDSGLGHTQDRVNGNHADGSLPNFFMPEEDMLASIRALQMATAAATNVNKDELRSQNKVKAVSELVNKMAAGKPKVAPLTLKNKQPPSAEEAKRIAKIFSSKMS